MTGDPLPIRRALLSASDKTGLAAFATALHDRGVELVSTGGTARSLADAGLPVTLVETVTGFPEILGGRVKTLHPRIHGGILARRDDPAHVAQLVDHGIEPIDLVCVTLYPFEATVARDGTTEAEAIEEIDIGGPTLIRAAAKTHAHVVVVTDPGQHERVLADLAAHDGAVSATLRRTLAAEAFARTLAYDRAIAGWLAGADGPQAGGPLVPVRGLRYGENPHQSAELLRDPSAPPGLPDATQLHGKTLSYNNLADAAAALALVRDLAIAAPERVAAAVVKHTNPCGCATAGDVAGAVDATIAGDPLAAYGGILALSRRVDGAAAAAIAGGASFLEVVLAPGFDEDALHLLRERWTNVRLLALPDVPLADLAPWSQLRSIPGGALRQSADLAIEPAEAWTLAAGPEPGAETRAAALVVWLAAKHLTSNAIAIGGPDPERPEVVRLFGAGAGQMDRVAACELAIGKAGELARGAIAASDAFFPFADGPGLLADAGVRVLVHPGGSKRDDETLALCRERGIACLLTGVRHFRH